MATPRMLFENDDWAVTADGLEHKRTGYLIDRADIAQRRSDGLLAWPLHMREKSWVEPTSFAEAFTAAAQLFAEWAVASLAENFAEAGWVETGSGWRQATAEIVPHPALLEPASAVGEMSERTERHRRRG